MHKTHTLSSADKIKLVLGTTLILGAVVRFVPGIYTGFPLNDGGMFYSMILDLSESNYSLPKITSYNFLDIPYAYPPFGFYFVRILSDILHLSELSLLRWIPPTISLISIMALYLLATDLLDSPVRGAVAASIYALIPGSFSWFIMGGGLTRALGSLFLLMSVWSVHHLFRHGKKQFLLYAILFCTFTVISHPEAGIHTAATCALLWLFFGRTRQNTLYAIAIMVGTLLFSSPWWLTVIANHGPAPFISALHSGLYGTPVFKAIIGNIFSRQSFVPVLVILRLAGIAWVLWKRQYILLAWIVLPFIVEPRSAASVAFYPLCMLTAIGFVDAFPTLFHRLLSREELTSHSNGKNQLRWADIILFTLVFYLFVESYLYGFRQVNTSLTSADRDAMSWVRQNTPAGSSFLLLTGDQGPETDAFQEWFPTLSARHSITTIQGLEWLLGPNFFKRYAQLNTLKTCENIDCIRQWSTRNDLEYEYILLRKRKAESNFSHALENGGSGELVYQTENVQIYRNLP